MKCSLFNIHAVVSHVTRHTHTDIGSYIDRQAKQLTHSERLAEKHTHRLRDTL